MRPGMTGITSSIGRGGGASGEGGSRGEGDRESVPPSEEGSRSGSRRGSQVPADYEDGAAGPEGDDAMREEIRMMELNDKIELVLNWIARLRVT